MGTPQHIRDDDRRAFPRVRATLPAQVLRADGSGIPVTVLDLSRPGMQLAYGPAVATDLSPPGVPSGAQSASELIIRFTIPGRSKGPVKVEARCHRVWSRRVDDAHRLGLGYASIDSDTYAALKAFIEGLLRY